MRLVPSLALLAAFAACAMAAPAGANEFAERRILGFSADGGRFAFEEFGVQDGSGFPYANLYVIDTAKDAWVPGTPIRVLLKDENTPLPEALAELARQSEGVLAGIDRPGNLLASNPITESGRDPYRIAFKRWPEFVLENGDLAVRLEKIPLGGADDPDPTAGFRLILNDGSKDIVLHEDKSLPASRATAFDYRISDVVMLQPFNGAPTIAVLVLVVQRGFEGPDGRYIAVTKRLQP